MVQIAHKVDSNNALEEMFVCVFTINNNIAHTAILPVMSNSFSVWLIIEGIPINQWIPSVVIAAIVSGFFMEYWLLATVLSAMRINGIRMVVVICFSLLFDMADIFRGVKKE